jgi:hypothetical protein
MVRVLFSYFFFFFCFLQICIFKYNTNINSASVPQMLKECKAQEPLKQLAACSHKSIAERAEIILAKVQALTGFLYFLLFIPPLPSCSKIIYFFLTIKIGEIDIVAKKCGTANCQVRSKKLKKCGRCEGVSYCSKECQMDDWPRHKEVCKVSCKDKGGRGEENRKGRKGRKG